jgi:hypothetical protein
VRQWPPNSPTRTRSAQPQNTVGDRRSLIVTDCSTGPHGSLFRVKKYRPMCLRVTTFEVVPGYDTSAVATSRVVEVRR